jgi:hypothetical protein
MARWTKPTVDTKFHIDQAWWEESGRNYRLYLREQLCDECRQRFSSHRETETVDWVNPETGEVTEADALMQCLRNECVNKPDFISERVPLTSAIFRVLLVNDNRPMSAQELHEVIAWKQPETILQTIAGPRIYLGIRPISA